MVTFGGGTAERERKLQTIIQKLKANEQTTAKLHQTITQKEKTIQDQKHQHAAQDRWIRHLEQQQQAGICMHLSSIIIMIARDNFFLSETYIDYFYHHQLQTLEAPKATSEA